MTETSDFQKKVVASRKFCPVFYEILWHGIQLPHSKVNISFYDIGLKTIPGTNVFSTL